MKSLFILITLYIQKFLPQTAEFQNPNEQYFIVVHIYISTEKYATIRLIGIKTINSLRSFQVRFTIR